jgi:hypothetical protein
LDLDSLEELDLQHYSISSAMQNRLKKMPSLKSFHWTPPSWNQIFFRPPTPFPISFSRIVPVIGRRYPKRLPPLPFPDFDLSLARDDNAAAHQPQGKSLATEVLNPEP